MLKFALFRSVYLHSVSTWCFLDVLAVVVEHVGGQKGGAAIVDGNDEAMVVVSCGCW